MGTMNFHKFQLVLFFEQVPYGMSREVASGKHHKLLPVYTRSRRSRLRSNSTLIIIS